MALADIAKKSAAPDAGGDGSTFEKKDISGAIPPEIKDAVDRIVAAGIKMMYAPATRKQLMASVQSQEPVPKKIAEAVTGLLLVLDQKAQGGQQAPGAPPMPGAPPQAPQQPGQGGQGLPAQAIFPAGYELAAEAATVLVKAGQPVTQDDFNGAIQMLYVLISKKMGGTDEQIMGEAAKHVQGDGTEPPVDDTMPPDAQAAPPIDQSTPPQAAPPAGAVPPEEIPQ